MLHSLCGRLVTGDPSRCNAGDITTEGGEQIGRQIDRQKKASIWHTKGDNVVISSQNWIVNRSDTNNIQDAHTKLFMWSGLCDREH